MVGKRDLAGSWQVPESAVVGNGRPSQFLTQTYPGRGALRVAEMIGVPLGRVCILVGRHGRERVRQLPL